MTVTQEPQTIRFQWLINFLQSQPSMSLGLKLTGTILRIGLGTLMIHNGFVKLADVQSFADHVVSVIGLPYPVFFTYCAAYTEIIAAALLAIGFLTRLNAAALLLTMLVAIYFHLKTDGLLVSPLETASLYALGYLFFVAQGGGSFSVDALILQQLLSSSPR